MNNFQSRLNETRSRIDRSRRRIEIFQSVIAVMILLVMVGMFAGGYMLISEVSEHGLKEVLMKIWEG